MEGNNYPVIIVVHFVYSPEYDCCWCSDLFDTYMLGHVLKFCSSDDRIVTEVRDYNDCGERHLTNQ